MQPDSVMIRDREHLEEVLEQLEGRLEVMADDGLEGTPDHDDADAGRAFLAELQPEAWPVILNGEHCGAAALAQIAIAAENAADLEA